MNIAAIDIGTNTILLLIVEVDSTEIKTILEDRQVIARLGKGVDAQKNILPETFSGVKDFLLKYKELCNNYAVEKIFAVGTSALRDAKNSKEFCRFIEKETSINIEIISGNEEALWTFRGSIPRLQNSTQTFSVIDIGGGSTEITSGTIHALSSTVSIDIGSVRLTERYLKKSPPDDAALTEARQYIFEQLQNCNIHHIHKTLCIGVAGTITTLAAIDLGILEFDRNKIDGYVLTIEAIRKIFSSLKNKTYEQILQYPQILPGRADILLAGIMILIEIMELAKLPSISVSVRGLRYGIILRELESGILLKQHS